MTSSAGHRLPPDEVLERLAATRLIAVVRSPSDADAISVSRVLISAGVRALEITFTTPDAAGVISALRGESPAGTVLGAGTICSVNQATGAVAAGADFLVSPGSPRILLEKLLTMGRLVVPGVLTPTEIMAAQMLGVTAVKLFPAGMVGPAGLTALRGPFPELEFIPTGGIAEHAVAAWLAAGALALGVGGHLAPARARSPAQQLDVFETAKRFLSATSPR